VKVVIVTSPDAFPGESVELGARTLGLALGARGHLVTILGRQCDPCSSTIRCNGPVTFRLFPTRRGSPGAFMGIAASEILSLRAADRCDAVVVVDSQKQTAVLRSLLHHDEQRIPVLTWSLEANAGDAQQPSFAVIQTEWQPPKTDSPVIVACDIHTDEQRELILEAYGRSNASSNGWSLAMPGPDGRWEILPGQGQAGDPCHRTVAITPNHEAPVVAAHAMAGGIPVACPSGSPLASIEQPVGAASVFNSSEAGPVANAIDAVIACSHPLTHASKMIQDRHDAAGVASLAEASIRQAITQEGSRITLGEWGSTDRSAQGGNHEFATNSSGGTMTPAITITAHGDTARTEHIAISAESQWSAVLGGMPLPDDGALEIMESLLQTPGLTRLTIAGCASAALLPVMWSRSVWARGEGPEIELDWPAVEPPASERQQIAGRLACALADRVACEAPEQALEQWGFDPASPPPQGEAFDLLTGMIDLWDQGLHQARAADDWGDSLRRAIETCGSSGANRVAIYGAGTHTRACGEALIEPRTEVMIIDDDPRRHGQSLWGYEIRSPADALRVGVDAVILSANSIEDVLWERSGIFRDAGIPVVRLYGGG